MNKALSLAVVLASLAVEAAPSAKGSTVELPVTDEFTHGTVIIKLGSPVTEYTLLFDPGSANTWVGAQSPYKTTSTSSRTKNYVSVTYGSGHFSGQEYTDSLTLGDVTVSQQSIGAATNSQGFSGTGVDGLLGLGPTALTQDTLEPDSSAEIPTVLDNLANQGDIGGSVVTIDGKSITFGTPAPSESDAAFSPITDKPVADNFWGLDASIDYGSKSVQRSAAGIIDHGSTLTLLTTSSYEAFLKLTGATSDPDTGLPKLDSCTDLDPLVLTLASGGNVTFPVDNYRWPAEKNTDIGGQAGKCYLAVGDLGSGFENLHSGPGMQFRRSSYFGSFAPDDEENVKFILGFNLLKHYTVILDADQSRIGIAE